MYSPPTKNWKRILAILTVTVFMMSSGYTMLMPFLPMFLLRDLHVSNDDVKLWTGVIFSISFLISTIMAPIWGKMADTKGRKLMALRASGSLAVAYFLGGLAQTPLQLFASRMVMGFASGLWPSCIVICTSFVPPEQLGLCLGILQAGQITGQAVGPLIGGTLATLFGIRPSFFVSAVLLTCISLILFFFIPEPPKGNQAPKKEKPAGNLLRRPAIRELLSYGCLNRIVTLLIQPIIVLYVAEMDPGNENIMFLSGLIFSLVGIASAISAPMWGRTGQKYGYFRVMAIAAVLAAVAAAGCAFPRTIFTFGAANFIYGLFFAGMLPTLNSALTEATEADKRGLAFGYMFSSQQFGAMIGPLLGGVIGTYFSLPGVFYASSLFLLLNAYIIYHLHLRAK